LCISYTFLKLKNYYVHNLNLKKKYEFIHIWHEFAKIEDVTMGRKKRGRGRRRRVDNFYVIVISVCFET